MFIKGNVKPLVMARREVIIKGADPHIDSRGAIYNYDLPEPVNWIGLITSIGKGIIRANHYHPIQEQKVLVISGSFISVFKDLLEKDSLSEHHLVQQGDLVVTPPNVAHAMIFLENTTFVNLVNGERKHENFGKHTIPHVIVKPEDVPDYLKMYGK